MHTGHFIKKDNNNHETAVKVKKRGRGGEIRSHIVIVKAVSVPDGLFMVSKQCFIFDSFFPVNFGQLHELDHLLLNLFICYQNTYFF